MKKEFLVINEKHERITIRWKRKRYKSNAKCPKCGKSVQWLTLEQTSAITGMSLKEILFEIEQKNFDVLDEINPPILICSNSVFEIQKTMNFRLSKK